MALLILIGATTKADTIADFDFEAANDPGFIFGYSDSSLLTFDVDTNSANGMGGTEGSEWTILSQNGTPAFGGGGIGYFDLSVDPRFTAGALSVSDLDFLSIDFDAEVLGRDVSTIRLESGGSFANRVELTPTMSGTFQAYSFDMASLDAAEKANLVAHMNSINSTELQLVFTFESVGGAYEVGNSVRIDNLLVVAVPEPTHLLFLGAGALALMRRRNRR